MTILSGAAWCSRSDYSTLFAHRKDSFPNYREAYKYYKKNEVLTRELNNFRRVSNTARLYLLLTGLAAFDAGKQDSDFPDNTGIICNSESVLAENEKYYKDYLDSGKIGGRGNLFVYTLPTSALGEAAISFGIRGPLYNVTFNENSPADFLEHIQFLFDSEQIDTVFAIFSDNEINYSLFFEKNESKNHLEELISKVRNKKPADSIIDILETNFKRL